MARLFSGFALPQPVAEHLAARLTVDDELRWMSAATWHVTLGFYGDFDDPIARAAWLRDRAGGLGAPSLRLSGAGSFSGVLWVGVAVTDENAGRDLDRLAAAADAGRADRPYHPHVTVARARRGAAEGGAAIEAQVQRLADYVGPEWVARELILFDSRRGSTGPVYTAIERIPLG